MNDDHLEPRLTRTAALRLAALGAAGLALGARPARAASRDVAAVEAAADGLTGRVLELIYLGDHMRCRMEVAGNDHFIVKVPNTHAHAALQVGQETPIGWVTEDCRALDAH